MGGERITTPEELLASIGKSAMPLSDALAAFAETLDGEGRVRCACHGLPLEFFSRPDLTNVRTVVDGKTVWLAATLTIGSHDFTVYSNHFPTEAKSE